MSKISIYIPAMKLTRIDSYCQEHKINRSKLFSMGAMAIVNKSKGIQCAFCTREAVGKFEVSYYSEDLGMTSEEKYLCDVHKKEAQKRQEVVEL